MAFFSTEPSISAVTIRYCKDPGRSHWFLEDSEEISKLCEQVRRLVQSLPASLACQSNPGPSRRGSWLLAFQLQSVLRLSLHFDLIRPIGMAPNKNQSSGGSERSWSQRRTSRPARISTRYNCVSPYQPYKTPFSSHQESKTTSVIVTGTWRKSFHFNEI